jgi:hypothetical protein
MSRKPNILGSEDFVERRVNGERRNNRDRRISPERRFDFRDGSGPGRRPKTIKVWFRSLTNARLGVDRRKGERRNGMDRRQSQPQVLLTQDELNDLLSL